MSMIQERYWDTFSLAQLHPDQGLPPGEPPSLQQLREEGRLLGTLLLTCLLPTLAFILLASFNIYSFNVV